MSVLLYEVVFHLGRTSYLLSSSLGAQVSLSHDEYEAIIDL
jgi:hypothetical protein